MTVVTTQNGTKMGVAVVDVKIGRFNAVLLLCIGTQRIGERIIVET